MATADRNDSERTEGKPETEELPLRQAGLMPFRQGSVWEGPQPGSAQGVPRRYEIRETEDGRFVRCKEAPGVGVRVARALSFSEADARRLEERVILLDGVGQFGPLIDDGRHLYNLDHHEGVLRAFTLASCEQALIVVLKGLELDKGDWAIFANEPDLDTLLAIWVLLNYRRVRELPPSSRDILLPLLRLEGAIDANGLDVAEFCGLPEDALRAARARLDRLFEKEQQAKRSGGWDDMDAAGYTVEMLVEIDRMIYSRLDFTDFASVDEEYGHVEIGPDRVAVLCRDDSGIYEVEKRLKKVWGDRLGIIALAKEGRHYTLRRTGPLSGIDLKEAYGMLNLVDPAVDGRPPEKRWGGSDEIGGSPRPTGTALSPREIGKILRLAYRRTTAWQRLQRLGSCATWTLGLGALAGLVLLVWRFFGGTPAGSEPTAGELALVATVALVGAAAMTPRLSWGRPWLFGWRWPAGLDWLALVPAVLAGGALGAAWTVPTGSAETSSLATVAGVSALGAVAAEVWFRGVAHGMQVLYSPIQSVGGAWRLSRPALLSAGLYAVITVALASLGFAASPIALEPLAETSLIGAGALLSGAALAMIRERSLSLLPCIGAQLAAVVLRIGLGL